MRTTVRLINAMVSLLVGLALLLAGAYAAYCLWDNRQIYAAAENVQAELLALKPAAEPGESGPTFDDLLALNPDVCAWITMTDTKIDYPVLQGESNLDYINTDVYGNFALAGSIFLDARNRRDFTDRYSLLYGHHMEKGVMFGDLDRFVDSAFFNQHDGGMLMTPDRSYSLQVICCLKITASDELVFDPAQWSGSCHEKLAELAERSLHVNKPLLDNLYADLEAEADVKLLALSTCASDFTDARTVVLTKMIPIQQKEGGITPS